MVRDLDSGGTAIYLEFEIRRVKCRKCRAVRTETLTWLMEHGRFTKRFEEKVGRMARQMPLTEVAELNQISWDQAWRMELAYMRELMKHHPPASQIRVIGVDEISVRKGHTYRVVIADLDEQRPIWIGGTGRPHEGRYGPILRRGRPPTVSRNRTCGYGHVESLSEFHQ